MITVKGAGAATQQAVVQKSIQQRDAARDATSPTDVETSHAASAPTDAGATETTRPVFAPQEFNFVALDTNRDGALSVREMSGMLPQLPPADIDVGKAPITIETPGGSDDGDAARERLLDAVKRVNDDR